MHIHNASSGYLGGDGRTILRRVLKKDGLRVLPEWMYQVQHRGGGECSVPVNVVMDFPVPYKARNFFFMDLIR